MTTKYYVTFQEFSPNNGRPIDHPCTADFEATAETVGQIPGVGDYVQVSPFSEKDGPTFMGRVKSRMFRYLGSGSCGVNIVIEDDGADWGALIKE